MAGLFNRSCRDIVLFPETYRRSGIKAKRTMLTAKEISPGKLVILVDARFADSFSKHLEKIGIKVYREFEPKPADTLHQLITAGTMDQFDQWKGSWTPPSAE